ncbi:DUF6314 family protein [Streptomyces sp. SCA3-4]|uniref:DUF6314 family protein n=1 Tax=Streptomyces sichuanensis TaxID=2871810 RepID=UPI001CE3085F|nr:DUF6314 family protein [Streptomyces sichuanensis]MCA6091936.1 DUF6314 family protein [Streptomyces sichuanensis]
MHSPAPPPPGLPDLSGKPDAYPVSDVAAYLAGEWTVERALSDLASEAGGSFRGTAVFEASGDGRLLHTENGELCWDGTTGRAGRTLVLLPRADGTCDVTFADGRFFHDLDLRTGSWTVSHPCAADRYEGMFTAVSHDAWTVHWRTTGPSKDHLQRSVYRRVSPASRATPTV